MKAWHFSENAYPSAAAGGDLRIRSASSCRTSTTIRQRRRSLSTASSTNGDRRGRGPGDHAQRASSDRHLRRSGRADRARRAGAADQEGAAADPRQSDRQPAPAGARRRGNGDGRRAVARPAGMRLRARRAVRDLAGQQQSGAHERAPMGGDRPDRQGLDQPRRAGEPRRPLLPPPQHQHLAAARGSSRIRRSGSAPPARAAPRGSARGAMCRRPSSPASTARARSSMPIAEAWRQAGRGDDVPLDRLAYAALVYTGETEAEAHAGAEKLLWYMHAEQGAAPLRQSARLYAGGRRGAHAARRRTSAERVRQKRQVEARSRPAS